MTNIAFNNNSDVGICSAALIALGTSPINSFDQNSDNARTCSNLYPMLRDDVLRQHPWQCCKKRVKLSPEQQTPAFGYSNAFVIPGDSVRILAVYAGGMPAEYIIEDNRIMCNADEIGVQYIYRNTNPASWDVNLAMLMVARVKWAIAYTVTREASQVTVAAQEYQLALKQAKAIDGQEVPPYDLGWNNPLMDARF